MIPEHNIFDDDAIWIPKVIITQNTLIISTFGNNNCSHDVKSPKFNSWAKVKRNKMDYHQYSDHNSLNSRKKEEIENV